MANTYIPLATTTLSSTVAYVDFDSIPQTYSDLLLVVSARNDASSGESPIYVRNNKAAFTSAKGLETNGSSTTSNSYANQGSIPNSAFTSNSFNNCEFYIPNYKYAGNHQTSSTVVNPSNTGGVTNGVRATAALDSETTAVTSLRVIGNNFISGSTFYLYGIKNT
jgi:hypothetical protein